jgi:MFS family permease
VPISATDSITLAFEHTKRQLFKPFRFGQWVRLAFVGLLAGELGSGGNLNPSSHGTQPAAIPQLGEIYHKIDPAILASVITVLVITGIVLMVVLAYISSVMRFILFDSVLTRECHLRAGWGRRQENGWKYFLWQLGLLLATFAGALVLVGGPAAFAFGMGWFQPPRAHLVQLVLTGVVVFILFVGFVIGLALVHVLTKDFIVPQMAFEGISALEAWRRLWPMIQAETKGYAAYIAMKIVLTIVVGIAIGIVTLILGLILAIPVIGAVAAALIAGKSAGLTWNLLTISAAAAAGCILFVIFFFLVSLISVPAIVFFPAYSIYFFAARYQPLSLALYSSAAQSALPQAEHPPLTPPPYPAM